MDRVKYICNLINPARLAGMPREIISDLSSQEIDSEDEITENEAADMIRQMQKPGQKDPDLEVSVREPDQDAEFGRFEFRRMGLRLYVKLYTDASDRFLDTTSLSSLPSDSRF